MAQHRQQELLHRPVLVQDAPQLVRQVVELQLLLQPITELPVDDGVIHKIKVVAEIIAQLLYGVDPHMDPGYLVWMLCLLLMTEN